VPLLVIYALILLAYAAQIAITQKLPQGMIGWMVLGFVVTGAATWLIVHPPSCAHARWCGCSAAGGSG
jgi:hypothetical protein